MNILWRVDPSIRVVLVGIQIGCCSSSSHNKMENQQRNYDNHLEDGCLRAKTQSYRGNDKDSRNVPQIESVFRSLCSLRNRQRYVFIRKVGIGCKTLRKHLKLLVHHRQVSHLLSILDPQTIPLLVHPI